jgi:phage gp29-like protein
MPLRLGRYGPTATPDDVAILKRAVASIGSDAAAVLPESMKIEFQEAAASAGGDRLYQTLCDWLDRQTSKAVLGQTMTTDAQAAGMGSNQANVHNDVRGDILRADARDLETTLNRDLIKPFVDLNFGPQKKYPKVCLFIEEPEDLKLLSESLTKLVPLGMRVEEAEVREKFGLREPAKDALLLTAPAAPAPGAPSDLTPPDAAALNRRRSLVATNAAQPGAIDEIDRIVEEGLKDWHVQLAEIVDPVQQLANECADADEFFRRLPELLQTVEPKALMQALATSAFKARALGDATDQV